MCIRDSLNIICDDTAIPAKLDALAARCEEAGRDRATLETSMLGFVFIDEDGDAARLRHKEFLRSRGVDLDTLSDEGRAAVTGRQFVGAPGDIAEQVQRRVLDRGLDGFVFNMVADGHVPGRVDLAG